MTPAQREYLTARENLDPDSIPRQERAAGEQLDIDLPLNKLYRAGYRDGRRDAFREAVALLDGMTKQPAAGVPSPALPQQAGCCDNQAAPGANSLPGSGS